MTKETKTAQKLHVVRPPIVVVVGHIDHGKTKILDWYRKTKVVEEEPGGITQHIGAYEVGHKGKKITFIDTPGHEAFSKLRSRGAKVADLAILVVAADEGVKPQTKEALEIIRQNSLPFIVAINKIDKPEANLERVKQQLAEENVLVESYGGKVPSVEISAKMGQNMDALLEMILLVAELEELKASPEKPAEGVVIEVHIDPKRGITAALLIRDGKIGLGDVLVIGKSLEATRILEDFHGHSIEEAGPSSPVLIAGVSTAPVVGDVFRAFKTRAEAERFIAALPEEEPPPAIISAAAGEGKPIFNIILKADVAGSKEALEESLKKLESEALGINIIRSEIGDINESDVKMAQATRLVTIVGFKVRADTAVRTLAEAANIHIVTGEVIYELLDGVKRLAEEIIRPEVKKTLLGRAKILKTFKKDGNKQIVGGRVEEGVVKRGAKVEVGRKQEILGSGLILDLQQNKRPVEEAGKGAEFGVMIDVKTAIAEGDILEAYEEEVIKRTL